MRRLLALVFVLSLISCRGPAEPVVELEPVEFDPVRGEVIAFVRAEPTPVSRDFEVATSDLLEVTRRLGVTFRRVVVDSGAPEAVTLTPLLVYQNCYGRSVFQGRYRQVDRFESFLKTSRLVPQGPEPVRREQVFVRREGRATTAFVVKVTEPTGDGARPFDSEGAVRRWIGMGWPGFKPVDSVDLTRSDRTFYMDFYPYIDGAGQLYVSSAVFSQFNCHVPIGTVSADRSFAVAQPKAAFETAARAALAHVDDAIRSGGVGDGFDAVPAEVPARAWAESGCALPERPANAASTFIAQPLPKRWRLSTPGPHAPPRLQFQFPSPLDGYRGDVGRMSSELTIGDDDSLVTLKGAIEVDATSVSMGETDLDASIIGKNTLDTDQFPIAQFVIESVTSDDTVRLGELASATLQGAFTMKGTTIPLSVPCNFEGGLDESGQPQLVAMGSFKIALKEVFGISGPDGPRPQRDHLVFHFRLPYEPR